MKKVVSLVFALLLVCFMAACGKNDNGGNQSNGDQPTSGNQVSIDRPTNGDDQPAVTPGAVTIGETVLWDSDGVLVVAKKLSTDGFMGPEIELYFENNSGKDLVFQARSVSVNGYMVMPVMSVDVANGKKAIDTMAIMGTELEQCGITTIADIEFSLNASDLDTWDDYLETPPIQIKTSAAPGFIYSYDDSGTVVYQGEDVKIVVKELSTDGLMGPELIVYLENTGDKSVTVQAGDVCVNGFMIDPLFSCEIAPGKHAMDEITFLSSDLEELGITEIENVELNFSVIDSENFMDSYDTEKVTISF